MKLWLDVKYTLRSLARHRTFTAAVVLTLAFGIGANTAIVSLLNPLMFRPIATHDADRLVRVFFGREGQNLYGRFAYPTYVDLRTRAKSLTDLAAYSWPTPLNVTHGSAQTAQTERLWGLVVSGNFFSTLGVAPIAGRLINGGDDRAPGGHPVVVISDRLWRTQFNSAGDVIGRRVQLNGHPFEIIGVAPPDTPQLELLFRSDLWVSTMMLDEAMPGQGRKLNDRGETWLSVIGRVQPNVPIAQAQAEASTFAASIASDYPQINRNLRISVFPELDGRGRSLSGVTQLGWGLLAAMSIVLLIAAANIAALVVVRLLRRAQEFAIRLSLGAGPMRFLQLLLLENMLLVLAGGALAFPVAVAVVSVLRTLAPSLPFDLFLDTSIDVRIVLFTFGVAVIAGIVLTAVSIWKWKRLDLITGIRSGEPVISTGAGRMFLRDTLVVGQLAISLLLLVVAGFFVRSYQNAQAIDLGFETSNRQMATVDFSAARYSPDQSRELHARLLQELAMEPGVQSVSSTAHRPLSPGYLGRTRALREGETVDPNNDRRPFVYFDAVGPNYFKTVGSRLLAGRDIAETDTIDRPSVAVVNETFARSFWPGESPLGKHFRLGPNAPSIEVVGHVADGKYQTVGEAPQLHVFVPALRGNGTAMTVVLHSIGTPAQGAELIRTAVRRLDPNIVVAEMRTLDDHLDFALAPARGEAILLSGVGVFGLVLAAIGVYGLLTSVVGGRTREIGVRVALGATPRSIMTLVLTRMAWIAGIGLAIGVIAAIPVSRLVSRTLYGVAPTDATVFALTALGLFIVVIIATLVPVRRAHRVSAIAALRQE